MPDKPSNRKSTKQMTDSTVRKNDAAAPPENEPPIQPDTETADPVAALAQEAADYRDKLLRTLAEMENLRKRTEREVADARTYGITSFARDVLGVADNMRRALDAGGTELRATADAHVTALLDGIELTERELNKVMEKHGIRKLEPQGEKFDPHLHQAMYEVLDASVPAGSVMQVIQPGYVLKDRVLRPALVAVAKGGPRMQAASDAADSPAPANDDQAPE
jgi:molecular chaperone GrpE